MRTMILFMVKNFLQLVYLPMKLFIRKQDKIVYLSRQSNEKSLDMQLLEKELKQRYPQYKQVFRLKMMPKGLKGAIYYAFWLLGDMRHLAGAKLAICDTYSIPVSCLHHKKSLKVIQIWHALGAVKQFGWQSVGKEQGRSEVVSKILKMHENYDVVIAPSKATAAYYAKAFKTPISKMKIMSLPHVDMILDEKNKKEEFYSQNPYYKDKKIVLYLPTFREGEQEIVEGLKSAFRQEKELTLLTCLHPLSKVRKREKYPLQGEFSTFDLMKIADVIITDYSACAFEAALLEKPLYFYTPDYESYSRTRGLNIDLKKEMKDYVFENSPDLVRAILSGRYDKKDLLLFQKKYIQEKKACTKKMADFVNLCCK